MKKMFQPESLTKESRLVFFEGGQKETAPQNKEPQASYAPGYEPKKEFDLFENKNKTEMDPALAKAADTLYKRLTELNDKKADLQSQLKQAKEGSDKAGQAQALIHVIDSKIAAIQDILDARHPERLQAYAEILESGKKLRKGLPIPSDQPNGGQGPIILNERVTLIKPNGEVKEMPPSDQPNSAQAQ